MFGMTWRKIWGDIRQNKMRTLLAILSVAVGVFAIGTIAHMRLIVQRDVAANYAAATPAHAVIFTIDPVSNETLAELRTVDGVTDVEGRRSVRARFKYPTTDDQWRAIDLFALPDYENIRINRVVAQGYFDWFPDQWPGPAVWPPADGQLLLERSSLVRTDIGLSEARQGEGMLIDVPGGEQREFPMAGLTLDVTRQPASFAGRPYAYVTPATLEDLGVPAGWNELKVLVSGDINDRTHVQEITERMKTVLEDEGIVVQRVSIPTPGVHPMDQIFTAMSIVLTILGVLTLFLSGLLVANTIGAVVTQQSRQIGVMKAVGASTTEIIGIYLLMVLLFGAGALAIAMPLAYIAAREFVRFMSFFINFRLTSISLPWEVIAIEAVVALLIPVLAALVPLIAGSRITVREAIQGGSGDANFGHGIIGRTLGAIRGLPQPLVLSIRNSFRRTGRMALTLLTLTLAGAIFISVMTVRSSFLTTLDQLLGQWQFDARIQMTQPFPQEDLLAQAAQVEGVTWIETWDVVNALRVRDDGTESDPYIVFARPDTTQMAQTSVVSGRMVGAGDNNEVVISNDVATREPDLEIGDTIRLKFGLTEADWTIVGVSDAAGPGAAVYITQASYGRVVGTTGMANNVLVKTTSHDAASQRTMARALEDHFDAQSYPVRLTETIAQQRDGTLILYNIIILFLLIMAVLLAVVGGLGLTGTTSINVLERRREIGVMRAIGASGGEVIGVLMTEGIFIGVLSASIATLVAYPLSQLLCTIVGNQFIRRPLLHVYAWEEGVALWFVLAIVLSAIATLLPAWNATRESVRAVLAYE